MFLKFISIKTVYLASKISIYRMQSGLNIVVSYLALYSIDKRVDVLVVVAFIAVVVVVVVVVSSLFLDDDRKSKTDK